MNKKILSMALVFLASASQAAPVDFTALFEVYDPSGVLIHSDSDVTGLFDWNSGFVSAQSSKDFLGSSWTTTGIASFGTGTHTVSTDDSTMGGESGPDVTFTVPSGGPFGTIFGGQLKWSSGVFTGVDIIGIWDLQGTVESPLLVAQDVDGDTVPGFRLVDSPLQGFSMNLTNVSLGAVPVPASAWLFGSGLIGLLGVASSKQA
jgi:hypothetical protein